MNCGLISICIDFCTRIHTNTSLYMCMCAAATHRLIAQRVVVCVCVYVFSLSKLRVSCQFMSSPPPPQLLSVRLFVYSQLNSASILHIHKAGSLFAYCLLFSFNLIHIAFYVRTYTHTHTQRLWQKKKRFVKSNYCYSTLS